MHKYLLSLFFLALTSGSYAIDTSSSIFFMSESAVPVGTKVSLVEIDLSLDEKDEALKKVGDVVKGFSIESLELNIFELKKLLNSEFSLLKISQVKEFFEQTLIILQKAHAGAAAGSDSSELQKILFHLVRCSLF